MKPALGSPFASTSRGLKVCVASGKGGVGKSTIAANLAVSLGVRGHSVVLVDGDLSLANLDILLGVIPERTVESFFREGAALSELIVEGPAGLRVLPAGSGLAELARLGPVAARRFALALEELAGTVDYLILDSPAGIGDQVVELALLSDLALLVTWPDPAALVDAYALLKVIRQKSPVQALSLVANGVASEVDAARLHARVNAAAERFLGRGLDLQGWVPRDAQVSEASADQRALCLSRAMSPAARAIDALAASLPGPAQGAPAGSMLGAAAGGPASRELLH